MTYHNLCVCFKPGLRVNAFCFNFLVQHWRKCLHICRIEKEVSEQEYGVLDGELPSGGNGANSFLDSPSSAAMKERSVQRSETAELSRDRATAGYSGRDWAVGWIVGLASLPHAVQSEVELKCPQVKVLLVSQWPHNFQPFNPEDAHKAAIAPTQGIPEAYDQEQQRGSSAAKCRRS